MVAGSTVTTTLAITGCVLGPPLPAGTKAFEIGVVPAGTYTFELYTTWEGGPPTLIAQQPLVVAAAAVPVMPQWSLAVLAISLTVVGFYRMPE